MGYDQFPTRIFPQKDQNKKKILIKISDSHFAISISNSREKKYIENWPIAEAESMIKKKQKAKRHSNK